ncbi:GNAT family N-acetyltransferase [Phanerochaete sordida]|uniref:GNAT family N-acetyltransferase n=1 Tax=Phanerochaete sordida TaxID=48140 RepID=A0A9P3GII2_9APHY|nr:GNAT family N-acetyltransferase [Phanerochaete sordida]
MQHSRHTPEQIPQGLGVGKDVETLHLATQQSVVPRPMRYRDIPTVYDTTRRASIDDPLNRFLKYYPESTRRFDMRSPAQKAVMYLSFVSEVRERVSWTANRGESYLRIGDPLHETGILTKLIERVVGFLMGLLLTSEQKTRRAEWARKLEEATRAALGDGPTRMVELTSVATAPERQGHGYASTLVRIVTALADGRGVGSWLVSSNVANRGFYATFGYTVARTFDLGGEDPTWTLPPVPIDIMVREPVGVGEKQKAHSLAEAQGSLGGVLL